MTKTYQLSVAVPVPVRQCFDYYYTPDDKALSPSVGARVEVPFGNRLLIGMISAISPIDIADCATLKPVHRLLDAQPVLDSTLFALMQWAADYYHHSLGECLATALPNALCKGQACDALHETLYQLTPLAKNAAVKGSKQKHALDLLAQHGSLSASELGAAINRSSLQSLLDKQLIQRQTQLMSPRPVIIHDSPLTLNDEQQHAVQQFQTQAKAFQVFLLEGVTGSGKTEVYLRMMAEVLSQGRQVMMLVPEIGLTPQTIERLKRRFDTDMAIFHSSLSDAQRLRDWQKARQGIAKIIIGTRSALFTTCADLGLIIIDEEHDLSYKQQDGLRYSARDLACMRAKLENIPLVLGSATPTLESLNNALTGKYQHLQLKQRAGHAQAPTIELLDIRKQVVNDGIAEQSLKAIEQCLKQNEQALLFINRRGFAPSLICHDCGWVAQCQACDARLTIHQHNQQLLCHHCGLSQRLPTNCPNCLSKQLIKTGTGTERLALALQQQFPDVPLYRIDRDTTRQKNALSEMVEHIHQQQAAILIGTQMLAKGHHFPNVTLVVVIDCDQSLVSTDYRAIERFGQLITQVTGRAGREQKAGKAIIQTHYPQHPQLIKLIAWPYQRFAMDLLAQRKLLSLPPFSAQALIRLEDKQAQAAMQSLQQLKATLHNLPCSALGPMPASLQRRAWHYRYQLLIQCQNRKTLHHIIEHIIHHSKSLIKSTQRWSIDIDPQDMS